MKNKTKKDNLDWVTIENAGLIKNTSSLQVQTNDIENCTKTLFKLIYRCPYTSKKGIGNLTELISNFASSDLNEFKKYYMSLYGDKFKTQQKNFLDLIRRSHLDINYYTDDFVNAFYEYNVLDLSFNGIKNQNISGNVVAQNENLKYKLGTSAEDTLGIDGYIGKAPIQVKTHKASIRFKYTKNLCIFYNPDKDTITYNKKYIQKYNSENIPTIW